VGVGVGFAVGAPATNGVFAKEFHTEFGNVGGVELVDQSVDGFLMEKERKKLVSQTLESQKQVNTLRASQERR
jgi:hypothetical protein